MPVDFAGAAFGAVLGLAVSLAEEGAGNVAAIRRQRKEIESFLKFIYPIIQENYVLYDRLGPQQEMDLIKKLINEGKELVKRKRIPWYKPLKQSKHSNKLTKYSATLHDRLPILILLLATRNVGEMLRKIEEIREELRLIRSGQPNGRALQSWLGDLGNLAVPAAPPLMVESEIEAFIRENIPLLKEGVPAIVEDAPGGYGETTQLKLCHDGEIKAQALSSSSCHPQDAETEVVDIHRAEEIQHLQMSNRSMTQNPKNMADHTVTVQVEIGRDDNQWAQNQQQLQLQLQQGDLVIMFHVMFGLLKLLMIAYFRLLYIIHEVIYLISLILGLLVLVPHFRDSRFRVACLDETYSSHVVGHQFELTSSVCCGIPRLLTPRQECTACSAI